MRIRILIALMLISLSIFAQHLKIIQPSSIIGYWDGNNVSGSSLNNRYGIGSTCTLYSSPTIIAGNEGNSIYFQNTGQYGQIPYFTGMPTGSSVPFSIEVKFKLVSIPAYTFVFSLGGSGATCGLLISSPSLFYMYIWGGGFAQISSQTVLMGKWYDVIYTCNGAGNFYFYINGIYQGTQYHSYTFTPNGMTINDYIQGGGYQGNFQLSSIKIYNRQMTTNEISYLYFSKK